MAKQTVDCYAMSTYTEKPMLKYIAYYLLTYVMAKISDPLLARCFFYVTESLVPKNAIETTLLQHHLDKTLKRIFSLYIFYVYVTVLSKKVHLHHLTGPN